MDLPLLPDLDLGSLLQRLLQAIHSNFQISRTEGSVVKLEIRKSVISRGYRTIDGYSVEMYERSHRPSISFRISYHWHILWFWLLNGLLWQ